MEILKFNGKWRTYQQKVLDTLDKHLTDEKLHIVAAPGAGKTTLGIEVIARLKRATLILAPTLTIRNQWKERILSAFLKPEQTDIISTDIRNPKQITITTYQALWAAFSNADEDTEDSGNDLQEDTSKTSATVKSTTANAIVKKLKAKKISLLCFDEAHHLRNEWWRALDTLVQKLNPKQTIALTATPPYDIGYHEWQRYENLCGAIDDIISIPELVRNGDLCPHQDFIYFSELKATEAQKINEFEQKVHTFMDYLMNESDLANTLLTLDVFQNPENYLELIYDMPDFFISLAAYLHARCFTVPKKFLNLFDMTAKELPPFTEKWAQLCLDGLLFDYRSVFQSIESTLKTLEKQARQSDIVFRRQICIESNPLLRKEISSSCGKLDSIVSIVEHEYNCLGEKLRCVVLADYIRAEMGTELANSLGVVPIFIQLTQQHPHLPAAILTGSLVVIPRDNKKEIIGALQKEKLDSDEINLTPFTPVKGYEKLTFSDSAKSKIVKIMTDLFNQGVFKILVGTQALLGEGWDAPSLNTLILSSTIASYVSSNQMRGRAIRKDKNNPDKIANIWHLASIQKLNLWNTVHDAIRPADYGFDSRQIERRFQGYEAPSLNEPYFIQSGWERLNLDLTHKTSIQSLNQRMLDFAARRDLTKKSWEKALNIQTKGTPRMHVGISTPKQQKSFVFKGSFTFLAGFYGGISFEMYQILSRVNPRYALPITGVFAFYYIGKPLWRLIRNGSVAGSLKSIVQVTMRTLHKMGDIQSPIKDVKILTQKQRNGEVFCSVSGLLPAESNRLLKAVQEILNPIENPRYILVRRGSRFFFSQKDYHAVPALIAANKKHVAFFISQWKNLIGPCDMIYTRSVKGRAFMLKTRKYAFSDLLRSKTISTSKWG